VLTNGRKAPFWSDHPLEMVVGRKGLEAYVAENGPVRITVRESEWNSTWNKAPQNQIFGDAKPQFFGENVVIRATPIAAPATAPDAVPTPAPAPVAPQAP